MYFAPKILHNVTKVVRSMLKKKKKKMQLQHQMKRSFSFTSLWLTWASEDKWNHLSSFFSDSPVFISHPHFFNADPVLLDYVQGLKPTEEEHGLFIDIHPVSAYTHTRTTFILNTVSETKDINTHTVQRCSLFRMTLLNCIYKIDFCSTDVIFFPRYDKQEETLGDLRSF